MDLPGASKRIGAGAYHVAYSLLARVDHSGRRVVVRSVEVWSELDAEGDAGGGEARVREHFVEHLREMRDAR